MPKNAWLTPLRREGMARSVSELQLKIAIAIRVYGVFAMIVVRWIGRCR